MDFRAIDRMIEEAIEKGACPSACVAIGRGNKVYHTVCRGVTHMENGLPVNEDTLYDMASLSKVMGPTMVLLQAIEQGKITLEDTLCDYFENVPDDKKSITIRRLMTHTAALNPSIPLYERCKEPEEAVRVILDAPLEGEIGKAPRYSCMSYVLLAGILEKAYGKKLDVLCKEMVFDKLGMEHTGYCPEFCENTAATEVDKETGKAWQGIVHDENARFLRGVSGNAGVFSTLKDCEKFAMMLAQMGKGLVSKAMMEKAIRNYTPGYDANRGLGFHLAGLEGCYFGDVFPDESFGHTGFTGTSMAVCPHTGIFVVILTNRVHPTRESSGLFRVRRALHNLAYTIMSEENA
ncbi:MAG: beta-lactamase family protein [Clostridia bacterium]|nr:beta-lactamase family protein [Clostridia bacterium]